MLELAKELNLLKLGVVSLNRTNIKTSASKDRNVTDKRAQQLHKQVRKDVDALLQQVEITCRRDENAKKPPG